MSTNIIRNNNFAIVTPFNSSNIHSTNPRLNPNNLGAIGTNIPPVAAVGGAIRIAPVTANQVYVLPSFSNLLKQFGSNLDTGLPRAAVGDIVKFQVFNTGTSTATVYSATGTDGGDGTAAIARATTANAYTGAVQTAHVTDVYLQFTAVNSGALGSTGTYTVFTF